jgi:hypothetical protein
VVTLLFAITSPQAGHNMHLPLEIIEYRVCA